MPALLLRDRHILPFVLVLPPLPGFNRRPPSATVPASASSYGAVLLPLDVRSLARSSVAMPARPSPLITKGHGILPGSSKLSPFSPLPSELPRTPVDGRFDALKSAGDAMKTPITPPTAYTDFLKAAMNSPAVSSAPPTSLPYSPALSTSGSYRHHGGSYTPATPYSGISIRRSRRGGLPPSPSSANSSPSSDGPRSARSTRSTRSCPDYDDDDDGAEEEDRAQLSDGRVTVKQVVTTTVTYTPRMSLLPAPKGKRRRVA